MKWIRILSLFLCLVLIALVPLTAFYTVRIWDLESARDTALDQAYATISISKFTKPIYTMADMNVFWSMEHVESVRITGAIHWTDTDPKSQTCLIAPRTGEIADANIEGTKYIKNRECCINQAYYDALLADPDSGFTGIGDTITVEEVNPKQKTGVVIGGRKYTYDSPRSAEFTVTGIVRKEGKYGDDTLFGTYRVYTTLDDVTFFFMDYSSTVSSTNDVKMYQPAQTFHESPFFSYQPDPSDPTKYRFFTQSGEILEYEEVASGWENSCTNAGFFVEVILENSEYVETFLDQMRDYVGASQEYFGLTVAELVQRQRERVSNYKPSAYLQEILDRGEGDEWYQLYPHNRYVARHTPQDTTEIAAYYEELIPPLQGKAYIAAGGAAVCAVGLLVLAVVHICIRLKWKKEGKRYV